MIVATPPGRSIANDCSAVFFVPIASNEYCTPPPVISFTISTGSAFDALIVSVAPIFFASCSFDATVSIAMIRSAPASAAPFTADSPMPPQPITTTVAPGSTFAAWNTAPTPVITPQPTNAPQRSSGMSSRIFTMAVLVHQQHVLGEGRQVERLGSAPSCSSA